MFHPQQRILHGYLWNQSCRAAQEQRSTHSHSTEHGCTDAVLKVILSGTDLSTYHTQQHQRIAAFSTIVVLCHRHIAAKHKHKNKMKSLLLILILIMILSIRSHHTESKCKKFLGRAAWNLKNRVFSFLCTWFLFLHLRKREREPYFSHACYRSTQAPQRAQPSHTPPSTAHTGTQHRH